MDVVVVHARKQRAARGMHDLIVVTWPPGADCHHATVLNSHVGA